MAPYERTVTTTRTTRRSHGGDELKRNISTVAEEIAKVRDRAREEVSALEKIRGMLDVGYLSELLRSVEELETRIETLEGEAHAANGDAERLRAELDQEQARLEKLWDAYKAQEDELQRLKRDYPLMEEKLFERERTIESLRREVAKLEPLSRYKSDYDEAVAANEALKRELDEMDEELKRAAAALRDMEAEAASLRELAPAKHRVEELERELAEERERLAKLYKVYEDLEAEKKDGDERLEEWERWYSQFRPVLDSAADRGRVAPRT